MQPWQADDNSFSNIKNLSFYLVLLYTDLLPWFSKKKHVTF